MTTFPGRMILSTLDQPLAGTSPLRMHSQRMRAIATRSSLSREGAGHIPRNVHVGAEHSEEIDGLGYEALGFLWVEVPVGVVEFFVNLQTMVPGKGMDLGEKLGGVRQSDCSRETGS
jgi:hypothetical protein